MAKYNVLEATFKQAIPVLGSSAWMISVKQGGYGSCEYDSVEQLLTLTPDTGRQGLKKRRIHVSNTADMVFGPTISAANRAGGSNTD